MRVGSHNTSVVPYHLLLSVLKTALVDRLALKCFFHPAVREGNHSFQYVTLLCRARKHQSEFCLRPNPKAKQVQVRVSFFMRERYLARLMFAWPCRNV